MTRSDTEQSGYAPKAQPGTPEYKTNVAEPTMAAIDALPPEWRVLVHEYGYIDVYRAYKRRWSVDKLRMAAKDGVFRL